MSLEIVFGPMFSGKSSYALSFIRRQKAIGKKVLAIKPDIDKRYTEDSVLITHNKESISCLLWDISKNLYRNSEILESDCIVLEEAQFFKGLKDFVTELLVLGKQNVLIVGLDGDSDQNLFGEIVQCIPLASSVKKLNALCSECQDGTEAPYTVLKTKLEKSSQIDVGGSEKYSAVCLFHLVY